MPDSSTVSPASGRVLVPSVWNAEGPPEHTAKETSRWQRERRKGRGREVLGNSQAEQMTPGKGSDGELGTNHRSLRARHLTAQRALEGGYIIFLM